MRKLVLLVFCFLSFLMLRNVQAEVIGLNVTVVNPSDTEKKLVPVKTYLPKGISPDDVVEMGNFSIEYDFEKSLYYGYQEIELTPKQTATLNLAIKNIWIVPEEELNALKDHTNKIITVLQKTKYADQSQALGKNILEGLNKVVEKQNLSSIEVDERISNYENDLLLLDSIRKDIGSLEDMLIETGKLGEGQLNELMGDNFSSLTTIGVNDYKETLLIRMSVTNPFDEEREIPFKYPLPFEVKPEYIVDNQGLQSGYDNRKGIFYLYTDGVKFAPKEEKEFAFEIKDLWMIQDNKITALKKRVDRLVGLLAATEYKELAETSQKKIISILDGIVQSQKNKEDSIENHIGTYRGNVEKFKDALKEMTKLERLLIQSGGSIAKAMVDNKAPKAEGRGYKTEGSLSEGKRGVEIFRSLKLKDKAPDQSTTWRVIWVIIIFLAVMSFLFFILWWMQVKKNENITYRNVQSDYTQSKTNSV